MRLLRFKGRGGPSSLSPLFYDTRFGTGTASDGLITFGLRSGCRRVWLNGARPDDSGDGLSAATAKKTPDAARQVWLGGGYTAGDQLMVAEGSTYVEPSTGWWRDNTGFSVTYPIAALSYDPNDAANASKYGRPNPATAPKWSFTGADDATNLFSTGGGTGTNYYAIQGIDFVRSLTSNATSIGFVGRHDGTIVQNCRFQNVGFSYQPNSGETALGVLVSKCSFSGVWSSGNATASLIGHTDGAYYQDCIFYHCGWKIGANRSDDVLVGGTSFFQHDAYYHATCVNGRFDRCVHIDSANDGLNSRGGATCTQDVSWDVPIPFTLGGFSSSNTEAPDGRLVTLQDGLIIGGARINDNPGGARNWGVQANNTVSGSFARNVVAFDSPYHADAPSGLMWIGGGLSAINTTMLLDKWRSYGYSDHLFDGVDDLTCFPTLSNSIVDSLTNSNGSPRTNQVITNSSVHSGATTYPNAKTRTQYAAAVCTALGLTPSNVYNTDKGTLVNLMVYRPDIQWAPILHGIGLPTLGAASTFVSVTPPNLSGVTPPSLFTSIYT